MFACPYMMLISFAFMSFVATVENSSLVNSLLFTFLLNVLIQLLILVVFSVR